MLGILPNSKITVGDGTHTTTYVSTGKDTIANLTSAINTTAYGNAQVTASLNSSGQLVLTGNNDTASISVGGLFASNIGFGAKNANFQPTAPTSSSSNSSSSPSGAASSTSVASSSPGSSTSTPTRPAVLFNSSYALQTGGTAETLLASSGLGGSLLNVLA